MAWRKACTVRIAHTDDGFVQSHLCTKSEAEHRGSSGNNPLLTIYRLNMENRSALRKTMTQERNNGRKTGH
jgi:hypothetical protein